MAPGGRGGQYLPHPPVLRTWYPSKSSLPAFGSLQPQSQSPSRAGDGGHGQSWVQSQAQPGVGMTLREAARWGDRTRQGAKFLIRLVKAFWLQATEIYSRKRGNLWLACWATSKLTGNKRRTSSFGKSGPRPPQGSWKSEEVSLLSREQFMCSVAHAANATQFHSPQSLFPS